MKQAKITKWDYIRAIRRTKTALNAELSKKEVKQDAAFIEECLTSLAYYRERLLELKESSPSKSPKKAAYRGSGLRRTGLVPLSIVLALLIAATVAEAANFRVWTALFKWDAGYLQASHEPNEAQKTETPVLSSQAESPIFYDYEVFSNELESKGLDPLPQKWNDYVFVEGQTTNDAAGYVAIVVYECEGSQIKVSMVQASEEKFNIIISGDEGALPAATDLFGTEVILKQEGNIYYAVQSDGTTYYSITSESDIEDIEEFLAKEGGD
ncbi:MAG: hypothetical protein Q4C01_02310 [Clostridia bacterium]|nr:hypothetical protein [Clostridia bacterium]